MHFFEYPYVIITILVLGFLLLGAVGIYFAVRGVKTANGKEERDFTNVSGVESRFAKSKKLQEYDVHIDPYGQNFELKIKPYQ